MNKDNWCLHINIIVNVNEKSIKIRFVALLSISGYNFVIVVKQRV